MNAVPQTLPQLIACRAYRADDADFFYRSWLDSFGLDSPITLHVAKSIYYPAQRRLIERLAARPGARIVVACLADDPGVLIGFLLAEFMEGGRRHKPAIHYAYVKGAFRRQGIARAMAEALGLRHGGGQVAFTHWTNTATRLAKAVPQLVYDPYLLEEETWTPPRPRT